MIPYFELHTIPVGPVAIQVWGLFVALGILLGAWIGAREAKRRGLEAKTMWDLAFWIVLGAMIGARAFYVAFYAPAEILAEPLRLFALWEGGMSIMGGFLGALLAFILAARRRHLDVWAYAESAVFGLPFGLALGRIGCFLIHDHPGTASSFFLAIRNPDGEGGRHDLGLYDAFVGLGIALVFLALRRAHASPRWYIPTFLVLYGTARFLLDFLRAADGAIVDARYAGLTPAQYAALLMLGAGVCLMPRGKK